MMKKKIPGLVGNIIMIKSLILIVRIMTVNICEKKKKCLHYDMTHGIAMNISVL